jgi:hypothetical protein
MSKRIVSFFHRYIVKRLWFRRNFAKIPSIATVAELVDPVYGQVLEW